MRINKNRVSAVPDRGYEKNQIIGQAKESKRGGVFHGLDLEWVSELRLLQLIIPPERPAPILLLIPEPCPCIKAAMPALAAILRCCWSSGLHGGECVLWYLRPLRFLYRFWHTSHL